MQHPCFVNGGLRGLDARWMARWMARWLLTHKLESFLPLQARW